MYRPCLDDLLRQLDDDEPLSLNRATSVTGTSPISTRFSNEVSESMRRSIVHDVQHGRRSNPSLSSARGDSGRVSNSTVVPTVESDFSSSLVRRLSLVEAELARLRHEASGKDREIERLNQELSLAVQESCAAAQLVKEMRSFLADYGLTWVGGGDDANGYLATVLLPNAASVTEGGSNQNPPAYYDGSFTLGDGVTLAHTPVSGAGDEDVYDSLRSVVAALNQKTLAAYRNSQMTNAPSVTKDNVVHRLVPVADVTASSSSLSPLTTWTGLPHLPHMPYLEVVLFQDGIVVEHGPFRAHGTPLHDAFLHDVRDGFYPYEYKHRYPNGVWIYLKEAYAHLSYVKYRQTEGKVTTDAASTPARTEIHTLYNIGQQTQQPIGTTLHDVLDRLAKGGRVVTQRGVLMKPGAAVRAEYFPHLEEVPASTEAVQEIRLGMSTPKDGDVESILCHLKVRVDLESYAPTVREQKMGSSAPHNCTPADRRGAPSFILVHAPSETSVSHLMQRLHDALPMYPMSDTWELLCLFPRLHLSNETHADAYVGTLFRGLHNVRLILRARRGCNHVIEGGATT